MALRLINSATWMAEYKTRFEEERAAGATESEHDARAVALADQAVRDTQGGGQTIDKTHYQDANEFAKLFMQYAIFFTRTYQLLRPAVAGFDKSDPKTYWAAMKSFLVLVTLPAVTESIFKQMVKPSPGDDTSAKFWAERLAKSNLEYLLSTFIGGREFSGMIEGMKYQGPASMRSISNIGTAVGAAKDLLLDQDATAGAKFGRSALAMTGLALGIPSNQIDHIIQGILYDREYGSVNPLPLIYGPPPKH
jgi:hypothetical protein